MSPEKKAFELFKKYQIIVNNDDDSNFVLTLSICKRFALIAVDEILSLKVESFDSLPNPHHLFSRNYWMQVRKEIENL